MTKKINNILYNHFKSNFGLYILVSLSFTIGICTGALTVNTLNGEQINAINLYLKDFFNIVQGHDINNYQLFVISLLKNIKVVFILWILGMTIAGIPFILIVTGIRGFAVGFSVACFINAYSFKGVLFSLMCIFPINIIIVPSLIFLSISSISFSLLLYKSITGKNVRNIDIKSTFTSYSMIAIAVLIFMSIGSILESFIIPVFIKLISSLYYV